MAQANVAREPSMDEILASIRRIIESNEPPTGDMVQMESDRYDDDDAQDDEIHLTVDDEPSLAQGFQPAPEQIIPSFPLQGRFQEAEAERHVQAERPTQPERHDVPPLSLADVAARVRAAAERNSMVREPDVAVSLSTSVPLQRPMQQAVMTPGAAAATTALYVATQKPVEAAPQKIEPVQSKIEPKLAEVASRPDELPVAETPKDKVAGAPPEIVAQAQHSVALIAETEVASLVSPMVSQQVARSFEDLAFAVDEGQRRSFDDIAAEMMRPMLQEWLDDNLPTLVERLVREEIERVARGSRR